MNIDITPKNEKNQPHGYWGVYWNNGKIWYKCVYINGKENGFEEEFYNYDGTLRHKIYHL